jgi:hypothetical protein
MTRRARVGILLAALTLAACGSPAPDDPAPTPTVTWTDYAPGLQARLDAATCPQLQKEFDTADANNPAVLARTGHNNADLLAYIDWLQTRRGCQT